MPRNDWRVRVRDILQAIGKVRRYTRGMDFTRFAQDDKTADAVVMQFVVIGEAARHLPPEVVARSPEVPWKLVSGMRNIIVHDYGRISITTVWRTVENDLDLLESSLSRLLEGEGPRGD